MSIDKTLSSEPRAKTINGAEYKAAEYMAVRAAGIAKFAAEMGGLPQAVVEASMATAIGTVAGAASRELGS